MYAESDTAELWRRIDRRVRSNTSWAAQPYTSDFLTLFSQRRPSFGNARRLSRRSRIQWFWDALDTSLDYTMGQPGWRGRVLQGVVAGLFLGVGLCALSALPGAFLLLFTVLAYVGERAGDSSFWVSGTSRAGLQMLLVFPLFLVAGVIGGALLGLLWPLVRWRLGQTALGMLGGTILYWVAGIAAAAVTDMEAFSAEHFWISLGLGSVTGGWIAFTEWKPERERPHNS
jgi:hypothetical protein